MKIITLTFFISFIFLTFTAFSQCDPATPEQCPDPENNGQVCPDSLQAAFISQFYSQVATIKPPEVYYLPPDSTEIDLHYVKLMEVGNLPGGITWVSNSPDSIFNAGEYYCILMEGIPDSAGEYTLEIKVDIYVLIFNVAVKIATVVDSTSLTLVVIDDTGIDGFEHGTLVTGKNMPNPFRDETRISFVTEKAGTVIFEVFSLLGELVHSEQIMSSKGENQVSYNGQTLPEGPYFYILRSGNHQAAGIMIKTD